MVEFITVMTDAGRALMADVLANEDSVEFTGVAVGNGTYESSEKTIANLKVKTALKSLKYTYGISMGERTSAVDVRLMTNITNYDPTTSQALFNDGFYINEIGVMARPKSGGTPVLFEISVVTSEQGDYLPHYEGTNPVEMVQDILARVSNEASVSFNYSGSAFALAEDLQETANDLSDHMETLVADQDGVHGIRYDIPNEKLYVTDPSTGDEVEVPTGGGGGGSVINVTTEDSEFYGQTVTLTDGHTSLTGTFDNTGLCTFTGVTMGGTLTASVTYEGDIYSNTVSVTYYGTYEIELSLGETFTLNISTTETTLHGKSITVTNGTKTKTGTFDSSGAAVIKIHFTGNVTLTSTDGTETASKTITVASGTSTYTVRLNFIQIYGASWDGTSTTAWTRTDDSADFVDPVPAISNGTGSSPFDDCMLWSGMQKVERTGGTMVSIPKFWYKITQSGNGLKIQIADGEEDGFSVSPAHMDRGDGAGERDMVYVGRYHCGASTHKSKTGETPYNNATRSAMRSTLAALDSKLWQIDFATRFTLWLLYIVEFADWNSQAKIGYGCGNNSGVEAMGYTDSMQYHTGTTQASRTTYGLGTQYRYIEGLWDNVYDWLDGCYYDSNGLNIIKNPSNFSDSSGGTAVGTPSSGYPSKFTLKNVNGTFPLFIPTEASGSDSTYSCDYWYFVASNPCLYAGGDFSQIGNHGLFYVSYTTATSAYASLGCRLLELP